MFLSIISHANDMSINQISWTEVCVLGGYLSPLFMMSSSPVIAACESIVASRGCDRNSSTSGFLGSEPI